MSSLAYTPHSLLTACPGRFGRTPTVRERRVRLWSLCKRSICSCKAKRFVFHVTPGNAQRWWDPRHKGSCNWRGIDKRDSGVHAARKERDPDKLNDDGARAEFFPPCHAHIFALYSSALSVECWHFRITRFFNDRVCDGELPCSYLQIFPSHLNSFYVTLRLMVTAGNVSICELECILFSSPHDVDFERFFFSIVNPLIFPLFCHAVWI